jgi:hypothetical protein
MATKNQHTISPNAERFNHKEGIYPAATHHPDYSYIGRILYSGSAGQVSASIRAPITAKSYYLRFKVVVHLSS